MIIGVPDATYTGFAEVPNPLFAADNTLMLFVDGKKAILELIAALKEF